MNVPVRLAEKSVPATILSLLLSGSFPRLDDNHMLEKIFDRIQSSDGSVYLATCKCNGDVCQCKHDDEHFTIHANKDSSSMNTKFDNKTLDSVKASAPSLPLHDLKILNAALAAELKAREAQNSKKALRLQRLQAAMASEDKTVEARVNLVRGELKRLGYDINASAKDGIDANELHKKMKAEGWAPLRMIDLKIQCSAIGLIED
jgi:hypothetical protein